MFLSIDFPDIVISYMSLSCEVLVIQRVDNILIRKKNDSREGNLRQQPQHCSRSKMMPQCGNRRREGLTANACITRNQIAVEGPHTLITLK